MADKPLNLPSINSPHRTFDTDGQPTTTTEVQIFDPNSANEPSNSSFFSHGTFDLGQDSNNGVHLFDPSTAAEPSNTLFPDTCHGNFGTGQPSTSEIHIFDSFMANEPANSPFTETMPRTSHTGVKPSTTEACAFHPCEIHKALNRPFPNPFRGNYGHGTTSETITTSSHVFLNMQPTTYMQPYTFQRQIPTEERTFDPCMASKPLNSSFTNTLQFNRMFDTGPRLDNVDTNAVTLSSAFYLLPSPQPTVLTNDHTNMGYRNVEFQPFKYQGRTGSRMTNDLPFARRTVDVNQLSDNELRKKLCEYGFPAMPVTETTRKVLRSKLGTILLSLNY